VAKPVLRRTRNFIFTDTVALSCGTLIVTHVRISKDWEDRLSYVQRAVFVLDITTVVIYKSTLIMGPTQQINQITTI